MENTSRRSWLIGILVVVLVAIVAFVAVTRGPFGDQKKILVLLPSRDNPFWVEIRQGVEAQKKAQAGKYDIEILTSGEMDAADQVTQLRNALDRGVNGVVVGIADSRAPAPAIAQLNKKGIPVVLIDTPLDAQAASTAGAKISAFIGSDNYQGGVIAAQAMTSALGSGSATRPVLLIKGSFVHKSAIDRANGFLQGAKGHFAVIQRDGEWNRQKALELTSTLLSRQRIYGIFASNDDMAMGAIAALDNAKLPPDRRPVVIGFDATKDGREAIQRGAMYASVGQRTRMLGEQGVVRLVKILENRPVKADELVPVELVTKASK